MNLKIKTMVMGTFIPLLTQFSWAIDVTVYNQNLGLVRETREFRLQKGLTDLQIVDVPSQIDATSVHFKSLTDPDGTSVLEQNFRYDLISQEKLLEKYLGQEIQLESFKGQNGDRQIMRGTLLSNYGGRVLKVGNQIYLNPAGNPILPDLPEGLVTRPTLVWKIDSDKSGKQTCEITYLTGGMSWQSDYVIMTNTKDDKMDLNSWVTINNESGAIFKDAKLKLVAGDLNRTDMLDGLKMKKGNVYAMGAMREEKDAGFSEKSFFEYHLYTLGRPTTLMNNETKQVELAQASNVPIKKKYLYDGVQGIQSGMYTDYYRTDPNYGTQNDKKVWVTLEFKNSKENNLGMPLPKGRIRVYKKDTDDSSQFIGEDSIDHTPKDEMVRVKMGNAFDLVGERKRTDYSVDSDKKTMKETFEVKLRNHKDEPVTINVVEHLYRWTNWKIVNSSIPFKKKDAQTIEFDAPVSKDGETVVTYTVKYWW